MFARFFRLRLTLKPFASPSTRLSLRAFESAPSPERVDTHSDYDRHPLRIQGFDHLVEREVDNRRFNVH
jgi:hypothetical protein